MMNTLQSGGIPGEVVDGVPMVGSHMATGLNSGIAGFLTGGGRMRSVMSNTIVRDKELHVGDAAVIDATRDADGSWSCQETERITPPPPSSKATHSP